MFRGETPIVCVACGFSAVDEKVCADESILSKLRDSNHMREVQFVEIDIFGIVLFDIHSKYRINSPKSGSILPKVKKSQSFEVSPSTSSSLARLLNCGEKRRREIKRSVLHLISFIVSGNGLFRPSSLV
jgi:hypothetical protein